MRCGCPSCGTYMIQAESMTLGCVCPDCGRRCTDCLGTDTLLTREDLQALRRHPEEMLSIFSRTQADAPMSEASEKREDF